MDFALNAAKIAFSDTISNLRLHLVQLLLAVDQTDQLVCKSECGGRDVGVIRA